MTHTSRSGLSGILAALLIATILLFLGTPQAQACSCLAPDPARGIATANAAFVGEIVDVATIGESEFGIVNAFTFSVIEWAKADLGDVVTVTSAGDSAACGLAGRPGDIMGILTSPGETGQLTTGLCQTVDPEALLGVMNDSDPTTSVPPITVDELEGFVADAPLGDGPLFEDPEAPPTAFPQTPRPSEIPVSTGGISPVAVIGGLLGLGGASLYLLDRRRKITDNKHIW